VQPLPSVLRVCVEPLEPGPGCDRRAGNVGERAARVVVLDEATITPPLAGAIRLWSSTGLRPVVVGAQVTSEVVAM